MKWILLTTETIHHVKFLIEINKIFPVSAVVLEQKSNLPQFDTSHPMDKVRDEYESQQFFGGSVPLCQSIAPTFSFPNVNDPEVRALISDISPDLILVFGTGKIGRDLISISPQNILNLHGGDPEEYRGLDSHLWTIYHGDFTRLITTIHHVSYGLDTGDIILKGKISLFKGMQLHELRKANTEVCIKITLSALDMYARQKTFISSPQAKKGRYYSFMPSELKELCRKKFLAYTQGLADGTH